MGPDTAFGCPHGYASPRLSGEVKDCSLPITFDTYSKCAFNCLYCFSFNQRQKEGVQENKVRSVNVERIEKMFRNAEDPLAAKTYIEKYLSRRYTLQWGGLADAFDWYERRFGVSLYLLQHVFVPRRYPLSISTKGTFFTQDDKYLREIRRAPENFHFKFSIISTDPEMSAKVEKGVPSPEERFAAMRAMKALGCHVTLRMRPFIPGMTSKTWKDLILHAKDAGAFSVSTEFMCLDGRAGAPLKRRYAEMSEAVGFDIFGHYKRVHSGPGYMRYNDEAKRKAFHEMKTFCDKVGIELFVSDAIGKELCPRSCCCGTPEGWKTFGGNTSEALQIAKQKGLVSYRDIREEIDFLFEDYMYGTSSLNTKDTATRVAKMNWTVADFLHDGWNDLKNGQNPANYYGGVLTPDGLDENRDIRFRYTPVSKKRSR